MKFIKRPIRSINSTEWYTIAKDPHILYGLLQRRIMLESSEPIEDLEQDLEQRCCNSFYIDWIASDKTMCFVWFFSQKDYDLIK